MNHIHQQHQRYLTFSLGKENFGIPLLSVREVIGIPEVTPIPQTPSYFLGIMNLRGQIITIVDLRAKLGIKPSESPETAVIICDLQTYCLGVVVDSINAVVNSADGKLDPPPEGFTSRGESLVGVLQIKEELVLVLDIAKTLGLAEVAIVESAMAGKAA